MTVLMGTIESLNSTLFDAGYQLMLGQTSYSSEREEALLEAIIGRRPDGIFLTGLLPPGKSRTLLMASGIPVVETWDLSERPVDMVVGFSHTKVGAAIAGFFLTQGWSRVGIATGNDHRAALRRDGFVAAMGRDVPTAMVPAQDVFEKAHGIRPSLMGDILTSKS